MTAVVGLWGLCDLWGLSAVFISIGWPWHIVERLFTSPYQISLSQPGTDIVVVLVGARRTRIPPCLHLRCPQPGAKRTFRSSEIALGKHRLLRVSTANSIVVHFACAHGWLAGDLAAV